MGCITLRGSKCQGPGYMVTALGAGGRSGRWLQGTLSPAPTGLGSFLWSQVLRVLPAPPSGSLAPAWERQVSGHAPKGCLLTRPRPVAYLNPGTGHFMLGHDAGSRPRTRCSRVGMGWFQRLGVIHRCSASAQKSVAPRSAGSSRGPGSR